MIIAVASGKGGTGKTTLSVNLASAIGTGVRLLDCDVEEPNTGLFLDSSLQDRRIVTVPIPQIDGARCDGCGECSRFCQFNAIVALTPSPLVFPDLCHGCGGCAEVCPQGAIREVARRIGLVEISSANGITLVQGRLDVGVAAATPLIREVKSHVQPGSNVILDAPPGTSCPVITTLQGADLVLLVTEPTPFGLHDLKIAVEMARELAIPSAVVVNRVGIGDDRVHTYCAEEEIPILLEVPDDRRIAEAYSRGELIVDALPEYRDLLERFFERIVGFRKAAGADPDA